MGRPVARSFSRKYQAN
uniref:Uncharacterized protein n=1 Tax=Anguilla anguilla TaxID=7936 RepID=A0A0E9SKE3_ANGAN